MSNMIEYDIPQHILDRESAKRTDRIIQVVCALVAVLCLVGAARLVPSINAERLEHEMVIDPDSVEGMPPDVRLLTKMGTFRAVAIDFAAIRMERLKNEDKFFELMQLSSWLCKLAPRFPTVWQYASWNQAYNISVAQFSPEARWQWVGNGIRILRDEGIQYNPKSVGLYKELAWTYWHKVGDFTDDYHWHYKRELAVEMERVLGAPAIATTEAEVIDAFRPIAEAPKDLAEVLRREDVALLVKRLEEFGLGADRTLLDFVARNMRDEIAIGSLVRIDDRDKEGELPLLVRRSRLLADPENAEARDALLGALRADILRHDYHMEPQRMLALMEKYGPLDWRMPYSMSLYWSFEGDRVTKDHGTVDPNELMNTVRLVFFSLHSMVQRGRLVLEPDFEKPNASVIQLLPDHRFISHTHEAFLEFGREQMDRPDIEEKLYPILVNYRSGHVNFLRYAIRQLWWLGTDEARQQAVGYYDWLRENDREENGAVKSYYMQPIEFAVMDEIYDGLTSFNNAQMIINDFLLRSLDELAMDNLTAAEGYFQIATQAWQYYMKDKVYDNVDRRIIPEIDVMRQRVAIDFLTSPAWPLLKKYRLWRNLDLAARQNVYDPVLPYLVRLCDGHEPPLDINAVFPEPPGMEEFREAKELEPKSDVPEIDRGEKSPT